MVLLVSRAGSQLLCNGHLFSRGLRPRRLWRHHFPISVGSIALGPLGYPQAPNWVFERDLFTNNPTGLNAP
jgi:hypothetical protein